MKIDGIKFILALAIAILLGFVCEIIAPEIGGRKWTSLVVGFVSISSMIIPAMGLKYENARRGVSIKVFAWIMSLVVTAVNVAFACFEYKADIYIVIALLVAVIGWAIIYGLFSAKAAE